MAVQLPWVQTRLAQWAASSLSENLGTEVRLQRLEIKFFNKLNLKGLLVMDQQGDTAISIPSLALSVKRLNIKRNRFRFHEVALFRPDIRLVQLDSAGTFNIDFITDYFSGGSDNGPADTLSTAEPLPLLVQVIKLSLHEASFSYFNPFMPVVPVGIDVDRLRISGLQAGIDSLLIHGDTITAGIRQFSMKDHSGFALTNLSGNTRIDPAGVHFQNLALISGQTSIYGNLELLHDTWADYREFNSKVRWKADFDSTTVNFADVGYFAPELWELDFPLGLDGNMTGTIKNLKGRNLYITAGKRSVFRGNFDAIGLPYIESTFLDLRIKQLSSDYTDLAAIGVSLGMKPNALPMELKRAGSIFFDGSFTGFTGDFVAYGNLLTEAGSIGIDMNLETDTLSGAVTYQGGVKTKGFDIGRILDAPGLGAVSAAADIKARYSGEFQWAEIDGMLQQLSYKGYDYHNIDLDGKVSARMFRGKLASLDPNLNMRFDGLIDFSTKVPNFDFKADIANADLTALKLVEFAKPFSFSTSLNIRGSGSEIDEISGSAEALQTHLCYGDTALFMQELRLTAITAGELRKVSFVSDVMDFSITGDYKPSELLAGVILQLTESIPSLAKGDFKRPSSPQNYDFTLVYKAPNSISSMFVPSLQIAQQTTIAGSVNSAARSISLLLKSQQLAFEDYNLKNITIEAGKLGEISKARIFAASVALGKFEMENFDADAEALNNTIQAGLGWLNKDNASQGDLDLVVNFMDKGEYLIDINRALLGAKNIIWQLADTAAIAIKGDHIHIDSLAFAKDQRYIALAGNISKNPDDKLHVSISDFNLADLDSLGIETGRKITGIVNLDAYLSELYGEPRLTANGDIAGLWIDQFEIGHISASSLYNADDKKLMLEGGLTRNEYDILFFEGTYSLGSDAPLDGEIVFDQFNMEVINILGLTDITDFSGEAHGRVSIKGPLERPVLKGFIDFEDARMRIDYLNAYFRFSDRLRVEDGWFGIDYKPFYDQEGNKGFIVASAVHDDFANFTYDISADVTNFLVMNTTREMNNLFYGTARATGSFQIGLFGELLEVNIEATTGKGTSIKLPLDESGEVTLENFVYFIDKEEEGKSEREASFDQIQMRVNLDVTKDAEVQLIFNEQTGDIIRGRGEGNLTLEIDPTGEFKMFGRYEISEGNYLFTLRDLLNKQFVVRPGGTVGWYGDPYDADIDIEAVYSLRTPLYPIMVENRDRYRAREDVNVVLNLREKLMNPTIDFGIELPQSTENERSQLAGVVSTTQQLNQQVFSLLILNRFLPSTQNSEQDATSGFSGLGAATTSDFVSTQISSWLSQISRDFDIGVNYRPGDQISNQEVAVALSTQLFNERLSVRGNFGVTSASETQYTRGQSGILGDFLLEYSLTENGALRLKVFNETNPYEVFSNAGAMYTQGVGLVYQEDFDSIDELLNKVGLLFRNEEKMKK